MAEITATLTPRKLDNLRPGIEPLIGRAFTFDFAGVGGRKEPYPRQSRWIFSRKHDDELGELVGYWFPEEDLTPRPKAPW